MRFILIIWLFVPLVLQGQVKECVKLYEFQSASGGLFTTTCGDIDGNGWKVSKHSCNFYTVTTVLPESGDPEPVSLVFETRIKNSGNLKARDFAWLFYYVNNRVVRSSTIRGDEVGTGRRIHDTLQVNPGDEIRMRISFVCDDEDKYWLLPAGGIQICSLGPRFQPPVSKDPVNNEKLVTAVYSDDLAKVVWKIESSDSDNYYKVEKSINGVDFHFAGFVLEPVESNGALIYSFTEKTGYSEDIIYKVSAFSSNGKRLNTVGESYLKLEK